ncbi:hypothetical protein NUW54_g7833 [Trametes sanguinea]|uniref:Uncharacterized protein n=1 Tax=Trametes sanguinea TaxID=158606 RepID=A0ACC1PJ71_9APHY|nr:hypothetical protein NUW54_g7833 [Trametes sanguinea]
MPHHHDDRRIEDSLADLALLDLLTAPAPPSPADLNSNLAANANVKPQKKHHAYKRRDADLDPLLLAAAASYGHCHPQPLRTRLLPLRKHALTLQLHTAHILSAHAALEQKNKAIQDLKEQKNKLESERQRLLNCLREVNEDRDKADIQEATLNKEVSELQHKIKTISEGDYASAKNDVDRLRQELGQPPLPTPGLTPLTAALLPSYAAVAVRAAHRRAPEAANATTGTKQILENYFQGKPQEPANIIVGLGKYETKSYGKR